MKRTWLLLLAIFAGLFLALSWFVVREFVAGSVTYAYKPAVATPEQIARGEYLARLGNCAGCHTARGGEPYAGGKAIATPFGAIYAGNLTPDKASGLGNWDAAAFYRALHEGRSRDGRLLYPAFPYPDMTRVTRDDSDAIFAYLMHGVKPVAQDNRPPALAFPINSQLALAAWRALYFKPVVQQPVAAESAAWNRGAYLVQGLAHCAACHGSRNLLGATVVGHSYDGAMMPMGDWYAPALTAKAEASVADWELAQIATWLKRGTSARGSALGPMAEVVFQSTQYANTDDLLAMATYLKSLPTVEPPPLPVTTSRLVSPASDSGAGKKIYSQHCADCHGAQGEGRADAYPALAGNRAVLMRNSSNLIRVILSGGFAPATTENPQPHGMPPYYHVLSDADVADVLSYIRSAWGNAAPAVTGLDMVKYRNAVKTGLQ